MPEERLERRTDRLNPEEQSEVMRLAARLQTEDADQLSPQQLAQIAKEAGIEERFVHEAVAKVKARALQPKVAADEPLGASFQTVAVIFAVLQVWAALVAVNTDFAMSAIKGPLLFVTGFLALTLGWSSALDDRGRRRGFRWILGSVAVGVLVAGLFHVAFNGYHLGPAWTRWAEAGVIVPLVSFRLGRLLRFFQRDHRKSPA